MCVYVCLCVYVCGCIPTVIIYGHLDIVINIDSFIMINFMMYYFSITIIAIINTFCLIKELLFVTVNLNREQPLILYDLMTNITPDSYFGLKLI